jgi:serine/threonine-protein kinase
MGEADSALKQRAEERIGTVLREKWHLDQLLGLGGMAAVYAATHRNGKRAAIKILHPEAALIPDVRARFLREGYLANKVGHAGAVSILDDDVDENGIVYLVMELLEGETLEERWRREERLPWAEALVIADRILDVLIAAHEKEIVHRDLKPGNVFIDNAGSVKILDFGIARLGTLQPSKDDTGPHVSLGTPGFMPPEQARGRSNEIDRQSDLWALGATLFAVLTNRHVHEADTVNEQLLKAMTEHPLAISTVLPELPAPVAALIDRALKYDKRERWPDAKAMQDAVHLAYEEVLGESIGGALRLSVPVLRVSRSVRPDAPTLAAPERDDRLTTTRPVSDRRVTGEAPDKPRSRTWAWAVGIGAVVALGVAIALANRPDPPVVSEPVAAPEAPPPAVTTTAEPESPPPLSASPPATASTPPVASERPSTPAKKPAAPQTAPKPSASSPAPAPTEVDIFSRRR